MHGRFRGAVAMALLVLAAAACGGGYLSSRAGNDGAQVAGSPEDDAASRSGDPEPSDAALATDGNASLDAAMVDSGLLPDSGGDCMMSWCAAGYVCAEASDVYSSSPNQNFGPKCIALPAGCNNCGCAAQAVMTITQTACDCVVSPGGGLRPDDAGAPLYVRCSEA